MADFKVVRTLSGSAPQAERVLAGDAMEVGDLLIWSLDANDVAKAANSATRKTLAGICHGKQSEDGDAIANGDYIMMYPLEPGMIIEGLCKDTTLPYIGEVVGLDVTSTVQKFEHAEVVPIGRVFKIVDAGDKIIQVRILGDPVT